MQLQQLLNNLSDCHILGNPDLTITGLSSNSKQIDPGNLFIARKGKSHDGKAFILEAIQAGACAVVTDIFDPTLNIVQIIHPNPNSLESLLALNFFNNPSKNLLMVGITGTNGKTTTSFMIKHLLDEFHGPCGLIGTIEYFNGKDRYPATRTTPDVIFNHQLLHQMDMHGCKSAVMEVTSHALDQNRVDHIDFDIAVFSNLTQDHLDYHKTMVQYADAKKKLFLQLKEKSQKQRMKWAIVNQDSPWTSHLLQGCSANVISYGMDSSADLHASSLRTVNSGTEARITFRGKSIDCSWPFVGKFNVYNCLAAIGVALSQSFSLEEIAQSLKQIPPIPGRLQSVENSLNLKIFVDYAHTDDALAKILDTLKELCKKPERLIVVFGCGGDRDQTKRAKMAKACEDYADFCIVTSDNPRSEDPKQICEETVQGFSQTSFFHIEIDRRTAIQKAIEFARPGDWVLIAGKGHETYQIFADKIVDFDDFKVASDICNLKY